MNGTMTCSEAWDIPNSNMVVNLRKYLDRWASSDNKQYFYAGVMIRRGRKNSTEVGPCMFNERGADQFSAFENLMLKIDRASALAFRIADRCDELIHDGIDVVGTHSNWEPAPLKNENFHEQCFSSLSRAVYILDKNGTDAFDVLVKKVEHRLGGMTHYAYVQICDEVVFKGKPCYDKTEAVANLKNAVYGACAMLEKFQGGTWSTMIDSSTPDYNVVVVDFGSKMVLKKAKED